MKHWRLLIIILLASCKNQESRYTRLEGGAFGTYYSIHYKCNQDYRSEIENLLNKYSKAVSKYDPQSEVSDFNRTGKVVFRSPYLKGLFKKAKEIYEVSNGALDPTLMPLIEAWGFGTANPAHLDSAEVDSLLQWVDFESVILTDSTLENSKAGVTLDLNAVGEGYGIDLVGEWLIEKGIMDFKVEIGGEVLCYGVNADGEPWKIGIENPEYDEKGGHRLYAIISLENEALGTSGSYRHFQIDSLGHKHPHILDPRTGYPVQHHLISVTVKAKDCVTADGVATACMVMGEKKGREMIESLPGVDAFFIYDEHGKLAYWQSEGFDAERTRYYPVYRNFVSP